MGYINISNNAEMRILLIIFIFFYASFAKENNDIDMLVANFCKTTDKYDTLEAYHKHIKLSPEQEIEFAITSLDRLLDIPQKLSLGYQFKMSKIHVFLDSVDSDKIPLKCVPTLFRALRIGSVMLTGDVIIIDLLDRIVGNNPGYTMQYLAENNFNDTERLALIKQWEEIFELNKENILKKRYYKRKYYGKKVAN